MKHKFEPLKYEERRFPVAGDLVRSTNTSSTINVVISVSDINTDERGLEFVYVRSVRYGHISDGTFTLNVGKRSRSFKFFERCYTTWNIVREFVYKAVDNTALIASIVADLKDVNTTYVRPEGVPLPPSRLVIRLSTGC
jgi:hypothetical protein